MVFVLSKILFVSHLVLFAIELNFYNDNSLSV